MKGSRPDLNAKAWKRLTLLAQKQGSISLEKLAQELDLGQPETLSLAQEVFGDGPGLKIHHIGNECWLDIDTSSLQANLSLSTVEWIELQRAILALDKQFKNSDAFNSLKKKIHDETPIKTALGLMCQLEIWDEQMSEAQKKFVSDLDQAIAHSQLVQMTMVNEKVHNIYPYRLIHLDGELSLIAEDNHDHSLVVMILKEISELKLLKETGPHQVTIFEVEEFIAALRGMGDKETRLILKIHHPDSVNLIPDHHFLGKPCMITNSNGDLIWAAYVEPCEDLFEWLHALGKNVEILDPMKFKQEYVTYCEEKLKKIA